MLTGLQVMPRSAQHNIMMTRKIKETSGPIENSGVTDQVRRLCNETRQKFIHPGQDLVISTATSQAAQQGALRWSAFGDLCPGSSLVAKNGGAGLEAGVLTGAFLFNALSVLDERRDLLARLLGDDWRPASAAYQVWLNAAGKWTEVAVDDLAPVVEAEPGSVQLACVVSPQDELWPLLLEKAYALTFGGWDNVQTGSVVQALRDLTGAAYSTFKDVSNPDLIWERLLAAQSKRWLTCFSCQTTEGIEIGLWPDELYLVVAVKTVKIENDGKNKRLIQIKDHRRTANKAIFRKNFDSRWTNQIKALCPERDDAFWVDIESLVGIASSMTVMMVDDFYQTWTTLDQSSQGKSLALFELAGDTDLVLSVDRPDPRLSTQVPAYVRLTLARLGPASPQFVDCRLSAQHSLFVSDGLPGGRYAVVIEGYWPDEGSQDLTLTLGLASDKPVKLLAPPVSAATLTQLEYWVWTNFAENNRGAFTSRPSQVPGLQA
jgi:hypothetical protein